MHANEEAATQQEIPELIRSGAPQLFALYSYDENAECQIEYWGMRFEHRTEIVDDGGDRRAEFSSSESAYDLLSRIMNVHLVWL